MKKRIGSFNNFLMAIGVLLIFVILIAGFKGSERSLPHSHPFSGKHNLQGWQQAIDNAKQSTVLIKVTSSTNDVREGTGFIFKKLGDTAFIATGSPLIEGASSDVPIFVVMNSGTKNEQTVSAEVLAIDRDCNLAIVSIIAPEQNALISIDNVSFGTVKTRLLVFGFSLENEVPNSETNPSVIVSKCSISNIRIHLDSTRTFRFNPPIDLGNAGGAIIDSDGNLVGIVGVDFSLPTRHQIALAVPIQRLIELVNGKIEHVAVKNVQKQEGKLHVHINYDILDPFHNIQEIRIAFGSASGKCLNDIITKRLVHGYWEALSQEIKMKIANGHWARQKGQTTLIVPENDPSSWFIQPGFVSVDGSIHSMQVQMRFNPKGSSHYVLNHKPGYPFNDLKPPPIPSRNDNPPLSQDIPHLLGWDVK
jgi:S1-C subfamily serine protease